MDRRLTLSRVIMNTPMGIPMGAVDLDKAPPEAKVAYLAAFRAVAVTSESGNVTLVARKPKPQPAAPPQQPRRTAQEIESARGIEESGIPHEYLIEDTKFLRNSESFASFIENHLDSYRRLCRAGLLNEEEVLADPKLTVALACAVAKELRHP